MRSDLLDAFLVFAEHLNLSVAAKALHLSQPALHAQIARLSEQVGAPLYQRRGRSLVLTHEGEEVARFARQAQRRQQIFMEELRYGQRHTPIHFAAGQGAYLYLLGEGLRHFRHHHSTPLRLHTMGRDACLEALHSGRADLGVTVAEPGLDAWGLATTVLCSFAPMVVVPRAHALASRSQIELEEIAGEPLIVPPPGAPWRQQLARSLEGHSLQVAVEASGWPLMLHFVSLGMGIAVVNGCCTLPDDLVGIEVPGLPQTQYVLAHREAELTAAAQALGESLRTQTQGRSTVTGQ